MRGEKQSSETSVEKKLLYCPIYRRKFSLDDLIGDGENEKCPFCSAIIDRLAIEIYRKELGFLHISDRHEQMQFSEEKKRHIREFCGIIGILFAMFGLVFLVIGDIVVGGIMTLFGVTFVLLALAYQSVLVKLFGIIEVYFQK